MIRALNDAIGERVRVLAGFQIILDRRMRNGVVVLRLDDQDVSFELGARVQRLCDDQFCRQRVTRSRAESHDTQRERLSHQKLDRLKLLGRRVEYIGCLYYHRFRAIVMTTARI